MMLVDLIKDVEVLSISGETSVEVKDISYHSERVVEDSLFVAIKGTRVDGHDFINRAIANGARALVLEREVREKNGICTLLVKDSRLALARLASRFYNYPSQEVKLVGITGTNGKTTTAYLVESILKQAGKNVGVIGTIDYHYLEKTIKEINTTPESLDLQRILRNMVDRGVSHTVIEVSSHALDLRRVDGCSFDVVVFTNLSRDHLDYHHDMTSYYKSKERLFTDLLEQSGELPWVAINRDDQKGRVLAEVAKGRILTFGLHSGADVWAERISCNFNGIFAKVHTPQGTFEVTSPLFGNINIYNILAATCTGISLETSLDAIKRGIESLSYVPGRLEKIESGHDIHVFVDYAHTSDALEKVLLSMREVERGRIICVFGCGGDRDPGKRPLMGEASARLSDFTVITSDNPRKEDPYKIMAEIEKGVRQANVTQYVVLPDRTQAIQYAINLAQLGDAVLIAGKGHENYQILQDGMRHFDDREVAREALRTRIITT